MYKTMSSLLVRSLSNKLYGTPSQPSYAPLEPGFGLLSNYSNSSPSNVPAYKTGGHVRRTGLAKIYKGEFILPASIKPTKTQKAAVAKLKRKN